MTDGQAGDLRKKARQAAQIALVEARQAGPLIHYALVARQLPAHVRQHGLGQMLVFLEVHGRDRETSPYTILAKQIQRALGEVLPSGSGDLRSLTSHDSRVYLLATRHTEMFLAELAPLLEKFA